MSDEWKDRKRKNNDQRDLVAEDNFWGGLFLIAFIASLIALNMYVHGFRFGF